MERTKNEECFLTFSSLIFSQTQTLVKIVFPVRFSWNFNRRYKIIRALSFCIINITDSNGEKIWEPKIHRRARTAKLLLIFKIRLSVNSSKLFKMYPKLFLKRYTKPYYFMLNNSRVVTISNTTGANIYPARVADGRETYVQAKNTGQSR